MKRAVFVILLLFIASAMMAQTPEPAAAPVAPDSTKLEVVHVEKAAYPMDAARKGLQGRVLVKLTVSETGDVEKVEYVSGEQEFKDAALRAAQKFKFKPFVRAGKPVKVATTIPFDFAYSENVKDVAGPLTPTASDGPAKRVRLMPGVTEGMLVHKVQPMYPPEARRNHVEGKVELQAVIGKDGSIKELKPIKGPRELIPPSMAAVQQWRYRPYSLNGEPVEVDTVITVNYMLRGW